MCLISGVCPLTFNQTDYEFVTLYSSCRFSWLLLVFFFVKEKIVNINKLFVNKTMVYLTGL